MYVCMYVCMCVCVCVYICVCLLKSPRLPFSPPYRKCRYHKELKLKEEMDQEELQKKELAAQLAAEVAGEFCVQLCFTRFVWPVLISLLYTLLTRFFFFLFLILPFKSFF